MLVSIIIPNYNNSAFIEECLRSCMEQGESIKEIIIVDDHSTDRSLEILHQFSDNFPKRINIFLNNGKGACSARNLGIEKSTGDYLQFLDMDDILGPKKIEQQLLALKGQDSKLAVCETWHFHKKVSDARNTDAPYLYSANYPEQFFINLWGGNGYSPNMVQTSAWLTPRRLIEKAGPWDESLSKDQDGEFFARVAMQSEGIVYVPGIKNYYRKNPVGSSIASKKQREHLQSQLKALQSKAQVVGSRSNDLSFHKAMALQYKLIAIDSWPEYKDIAVAALEKMKEYGGSNFVPVLGGKIVELFKDIFGWKAARYFAHYGRKILNNNN